MITPSVLLSKTNLGHAAYIASCRHLKIFTTLGGDHPVMQKFDAIETLVRTCQAEMAVAKFFGVAWDTLHFNGQQWLEGVEVDGAAGGIVVRAIQDPNGPLVVTEKDPPNSPVVLVLADRKPEFVMVGWMWGVQARHWPVENRQINVPQGSLADISTLPIQMVQARRKRPTICFPSPCPSAGLTPLLAAR